MKKTALEKGDVMAVVAPASPPLEAEAVTRGVAELKARGYRVEQVRAAYPVHGYLAGTDEERIAEFNSVLRRDDVRVVMCVRGGYGALRLLPHLDYEAARRHPKILIGYSDITALHLALYHRAGWTGLSGDMLAVEWARPDAEAEPLFWKALNGEVPYEVEGPGERRLVPLRPGTAEGVLIGGNLTLVTRLLGTPYLPDLDGALLFLEEVDEPPYRIDGMLAHLKLSGVLDRIGGLIFGGFTGGTPRKDRPTLSLDDVIADYATDLSVPVVKGLAYGHFPKKHAMPVGVRARLTATDRDAVLTVLDPLTA